jgi:predicted acylesterase/phospholipase RssA
MRIFVTLLALFVAACGSDKPINFDCPRIAEFRIPVPVTPGGPIPLIPESLDTVFADAAARRSDAGLVAGPRATNIAVLSGGGKWGAYGAGLFDAWSEQSSLPRPSFDVVTGISTGALQSTFVFVGSSADEGLIDAYDIERESELVKRHGKLFFLTHGSTTSLLPLADYAKRRAEPFYETVANEFRTKNRRLLVGAVDALDGRMYAIDLTRIAAELSGKERSECYVGALLAAAAIPAVFKQVTINQRPYFDAGVRHSVFLTGVQGSAARALSAGGHGGNLFILMNGVPGVQARTRVKPTLFGALGRLREITFDQIEQNSVYAVSQQASGLMSWVATAEGHGCDETNSDEDIFNPVFMRCLIRAGRDSWSGAGPWRRFPA